MKIRNTVLFLIGCLFALNSYAVTVRISRIRADLEAYKNYTEVLHESVCSRPIVLCQGPNLEKHRDSYLHVTKEYVLKKVGGQTKLFLNDLMMYQDITIDIDPITIELDRGVDTLIDLCEQLVPLYISDDVDKRDCEIYLKSNSTLSDVFVCCLRLVQPILPESRFNIPESGFNISSDDWLQTMFPKGPDGLPSHDYAVTSASNPDCSVSPLSLSSPLTSISVPAPSSSLSSGSSCSSTSSGSASSSSLTTSTDIPPAPFCFTPLPPIVI